jgi:daunosaminyl-N,N-dimethyltransferase/N-dimethyltransferase
MLRKNHPGARFSDPAWLYELVHRHKSYDADGARLIAALERHGVTAGRVCEGACGTGSYLTPLAERFEVSGFDLDRRMLNVAQGKLPGRHLWRGDLCQFTVSQPVDALLLLFGAVGYVPPDELAGHAAAVAQAVRPGGVVLLEPWLTAEHFHANLPHMLVVDTRFLKICRQVVPKRDGLRSILEFHYLVSRPDFGVVHLVETETLTMHPHDELLAHYAAAGLACVDQEPGLMADNTLYVLRASG